VLRGRIVLGFISTENKVSLGGVLRLIALTGFIAATAASLLSYLSPFDFLFELMSHFRVQYLLVQFVSGVILLLGAERAWMKRALILLLLNLVPIAPYYFPQRDAAVTDKLKIIQLNLLYNNQSVDKVFKLVKDVDPDFIALEEYTYQWDKKLQGLRGKFPYCLSVPTDHPFGIALYSKRKFLKQNVEYYGDGFLKIPTLNTEFLLGKEKVSLLVTHPVPPSGVEGAHFRNLQLEEIAKHRQTYDKNLIIAGDLNTSQWSSYFQDLVHTTGLSDTQLGFGVQASWPSMQLIIQTPIDHVLVSENFVVLDRRLGPDVGSDHLPVIVELGLRKDG
jgi:endonuclease/exonuclease/phosphatase (EEP) superfamily protein YafD